MSVPRFRKRRAGVGVVGRTISGGKVKWRGWIVRIEQGCAGGQSRGGGSSTGVYVRDGLRKAHQGGGDG